MGDDRAFGGDVEGEVGGAFVDGPFEGGFIALIETNEEELGDGDSGVVGGDEFFFGFGIRIVTY